MRLLVRFVSTERVQITRHMPPLQEARCRLQHEHQHESQHDRQDNFGREIARSEQQQEERAVLTSRGKGEIIISRESSAASASVAVPGHWLVRRRQSSSFKVSGKEEGRLR